MQARARQSTWSRWPLAAAAHALEFARPEHAEPPRPRDRCSVVTPPASKLPWTRIWRRRTLCLRQVTNRDGRAVALDCLTLQVCRRCRRREATGLDTGMLRRPVEDVDTVDPRLAQD